LVRADRALGRTRRTRAAVFARVTRPPRLFERRGDATVAGGSVLAPPSVGASKAVHSV